MTTNWFNLPDEPDEDPEPQVWTLADIYADLGTTHDVAKHLDVSWRRLYEWATRPKFVNSSPRPVCKFGATNVYSKQEWTDWYDKFMEGKRPGTAWTNTRGYTETRVSKLDPDFKFGNPGLNNALLDWRKAQERAGNAD